MQANVLDSIKDKIEDAKDSVVGAVTGKHEEEHKEGEHAKSDEKDDDEGKLATIFHGQVAHKDNNSSLNSILSITRASHL